jgi:hypothetical protein
MPDVVTSNNWTRTAGMADCRHIVTLGKIWLRTEKEGKLQRVGVNAPTPQAPQ